MSRAVNRGGRVCAVAALAALGAVGAASASDVGTEIELRLTAAAVPLWVAADARGAAQWEALQRFYKERGFAPAWLDEGGPRPQALALMDVLRSVQEAGLDPSRYAPVRAALAAADDRPQWPTALADRDLQMSHAFLRLAQDLLEGRVSARGASPYWAAAPAAETDALALLQAAEARGPQAVLAALSPQHAQYAALLRALSEHSSVAAAGGWPQVPDQAPPKRARKDPRLPVLRERLAISGDLDPRAPAADPAVLDRVLQQALRRFQWRHGLAPDGRLGAETLAALNVRVEERIAQIELNLERWRWLPQQLGPRYVLVNVPAFELHAFQDGTEAARMKVVTGKAGETPTPIFSADMTAMAFSPWWNVPPRIAEEEILPEVEKSRSYLRRRGLQAVSDDSGLQFRQPPGPTNPMGMVKFLLPNPFNVYLHDTPNDALFAAPRRDFSHGCMRVSQPMALARWALQDTLAWPDTRIRAAMRAGREEVVPVPAAIPVHVVYFTAWVEDDGTVRFLPDVYGHDAAQLALLRGQGPWRRMAQSGTTSPGTP